MGSVRVLVRPQVLPQLLAYIEQEEEPTSNDCLDWGTVAVYTCSASCCAPEGEPQYVEEFTWHQQL